MLISKSEIVSISSLNRNTYLLVVNSQDIASITKPGQFCNVKVSEYTAPLLRRPLSISYVENKNISFIFNVVGKGTKMLSEKKIGDTLDILGPLGNGFNYTADYETAVIAAGGLGVAPFPFLSKVIFNHKKILSFVGGRTKDDVITYGIHNVHTATDDGSLGLKGTVIDLLETNKDLFKNKKIKLFACGPYPMLAAIQKFSIKNNINCEISLEGMMACGFGICQGCPIPSSKGDEYLLMCKDGPVFNVKDIIL